MSSSATLAPTKSDYEGVLTAVVAVTGVRDDVQDVLVPGAFRDTLSKRRPKVCLHHQWQQPVGRVLDIKELMPGDPRLPQRTRVGQNWPREWGALVATMQFALGTQAGREAFELARFYSEAGDADWSIGYKALEGKAAHRAGTRYLYAVDLYELSLVLHGANANTFTIDVKSAEEPELEHQGIPDEARSTESAAFAVMQAQAAERGAEVEAKWPTVAVVEIEETLDLEPDELEALEVEVKAPTPPGVKLGTREDIAAAVKAYPKMPMQMRPGARKRIMMAAKKLGCLDDIPGSWKSPQMMTEAGLKPGSMSSGKSVEDEIEVKYDTSPVGTPGGRQNWVDQEKGLPPFIRAVAHALIRLGHSEQNAIEMAVGVIRRWATGGGNVTAKTRAKAAATIARWEAMKASARARPNKAGEPEDLEHKMGMGTPMAGSLEDRRDRVREAVNTYFSQSDGEGDVAGCDVVVEATFPDSVIASTYASGERKSFQIAYTVDDSGDIQLGKPEPVTLTVVAVPDDSADLANGQDVPEEDAAIVRFLSPALSMISEAEGKLMAASREGKAVDLEALRPAVETLLATLQDLGMDLESLFEYEDGAENEAEDETEAKDDEAPEEEASEDETAEEEASAEEGEEEVYLTKDEPDSKEPDVQEPKPQQIGDPSEPQRVVEDPTPETQPETKAADKTPYGKVTYADPGYQKDKVKRYPLDSEQHVRAAWSYINQEKNASQYTPEQLVAVKKKIKAAAKKYGIEIADTQGKSVEPETAPDIVILDPTEIKAQLAALAL